MLLTPVLEKPVDSTQDLLDREMNVIIQWGGDFWINFLRTSDNPVYRELGERTIMAESDDDLLQIFREHIHGTGTAAYLTSFLFDFEEDTGEWHTSKETIGGTSPYTHFLQNKRWSMNDMMARLLMIYEQVCRNLKEICIANVLKMVQIYSRLP